MTVREAVEKTRSKLQEREGWREIKQEARAVHRYHRARDEIEEDRRSGRISRQEASRRMDRTERLFERDRKTPERRLADATETSLKKGSEAVKTFVSDAPRPRPIKRRKRYSTTSRAPTAGERGGIVFPSLGYNSPGLASPSFPGLGGDIGGGLNIGPADFGSLNAGISRKKKGFGPVDFGSLNNIF
ncbi:MAG: hypothetical protein PHT95_04975 [Candidatus Omnitrophica bacterium]|jgi:hypothetical protein|nr:hypothetical protein [Candidatus Omnitrophota bacterium]